MFALKTNKKEQPAVAINRIVAIVNDKVITQAQLNDELIMIKKRLTQAGTPLPSDHVLKQQVLQQMINQTLQLQLADKTGIRVSNYELNAALQRIAKQNNQTLAGLYQAVKRDGWTVDSFRKEIRDEIIIQKLQNRELAPRVSISEQEVDDYLQASASKSNAMPEYHLGDILIALPDTPSPAQVMQAKKKAEAIMQKLKSGADFKKVAVAVSGDTEEALEGGDLGWRKLAELPTAFAAAVKNMKIGEVAGPIQAPNGFHIIKLLGKHNAALGRTAIEAEVQIIFMKHGIDKKNDQEIKQELLALRERINSGSSFDMLAKKYSDDKKSAKQGGYLGWVSIAKFGPVAAIELEKLTAGSLSQPISTAKGWYLIEVIAKRQAPKTTTTEKREIEQLIFKRKLNEAIQSFLNELRSQSYVKVYLD